MISDRCYHCGKKIYLARWRGHYRTEFRWMDDPKHPDSWSCTDFTSHAPKELIDYEQRSKEDSIRNSDATNPIEQSERQAPKAEA